MTFLRYSGIRKAALLYTAFDQFAVIIKRNGKALDFSFKQIFKIFLVVLKLVQNI